MDEQDIQVKTKFDEYLKEMPSEVQDFMWSDLYDVIITAIQQTLSLTNEQTVLVKNAGYDLLMQTKTMNEVTGRLKDAGMNDDLIAKILYLIDTEILTRAENITEFYTEEAEGTEATTNEWETIKKSNASPNASDVFARLNQTLVPPTTLAPTKRENVPKPPVAPDAPKTPAFDPYRELPGK